MFKHQSTLRFKFYIWALEKRFGKKKSTDIFKHLLGWNKWFFFYIHVHEHLDAFTILTWFIIIVHPHLVLYGHIGHRVPSMCFYRHTCKPLVQLKYNIHSTISALCGHIGHRVPSMCFYRHTRKPLVQLKFNFHSVSVVLNNWNKITEVTCSFLATI